MAPLAQFHFCVVFVYQQQPPRGRQRRHPRGAQAVFQEQGRDPLTYFLLKKKVSKENFDDMWERFFAAEKDGKQRKLR